ncbi:hypothetical protein RND61_30770 [Streptomyces sp. TRM76323]|uniref:DUF2188 domain-containing protein n=1 Tax=Streptomyces tamarix TaxID=3078565 RepID=A0ABU3QVN4_9ACTN|nr:hypothetical protein [Streptomyces tamarix]MDT9686422.1 hypothetical protein [Streptomyces tamarix]
MSTRKLWTIEQLDGEVWKRALVHVPCKQTDDEARQALRDLVAANSHLPWRAVEVTRHPDGTEVTTVLTGR